MRCLLNLADATIKQLPKWATTELFEIEARAAGNPTKNEMRLMMRSLLAERFQLMAHFETHEGPVFALTLVKPGQTGPKLRPHAEDRRVAILLPSHPARDTMFPRIATRTSRVRVPTGCAG